MLCFVGHDLWLGELEVSSLGLALEKLQVGVEVSIGLVLLKAQDLYPNQCQTWKL